MGNYNTICEYESCKTKIKKFQSDIYHCKNHRCVVCNIPRENNSHYCKYHIYLNNPLFY